MSIVVRSSFSICASALDVPIVAPEGSLSDTVNASSASEILSPATFTVTAFVVSPAAKPTVPDGRTPPKSAASAGLSPDPETAQAILLLPDVSPLRVTTNVNGVRSLSPSGKRRRRGSDGHCCQRSGRTHVDPVTRQIMCGPSIT